MILKIFLFILLLIIAMLGLTAIILRRLFHHLGLNKIFNLLKGQSGHYQHTRQSSSRQTKQRRRQTQTSSGDIIIDRRSPEEVNQKIFDENEGEYVDFVEE
jgi:hypothetical protein